MTPLSPPIQSKLWQVACAHNVERVALHKIMGAPHYTESNSFATYGGEEDWWGYQLHNGQLAVLCLRVPYRDAIICSDQQQITNEVLRAFSSAIALGNFEVYQHAYAA